MVLEWLFHGVSLKSLYGIVIHICSMVSFLPSSGFRVFLCGFMALKVVSHVPFSCTKIAVQPYNFRHSSLEESQPPKRQNSKVDILLEPSTRMKTAPQPSLRPPKARHEDHVSFYGISKMHENT